jgi:hypothetical protein
MIIQQRKLVTKILLSATVALSLAITTGTAKEVPTPGYNIKIPKNIMTPDKVDSRIGELTFFDSGPKHPKDTRTPGYRPYQTNRGSWSSVSTDHSSLSMTKRGSRVRSS